MQITTPLLAAALLALATGPASAQCIRDPDLAASSLHLLTAKKHCVGFADISELAVVSHMLNAGWVSFENRHAPACLRQIDGLTDEIWGVVRHNATWCPTMRRFQAEGRYRQIGK